MPAKGNFYVIGDVHGCSEELKILIHKLKLDQNSTILFLGDYVDRGPDSKGVIDTVLNVSELYKVIALRGNHEWLMEEYLAKPTDPLASSNFILNGGSNTLASYSTDGTSYEIPQSHKDFLRDLKICHFTETHLFVHAGIPPDFDFSGPIDKKTEHQMMWIRSVFLESKVHWPRVIVHGHTPVHKAEMLPNRINLDTGCVFGRRLTAMNMTTGELISVERNQVADRRFLSQSFHGRPRAQRYEGTIAVEIRKGFTTVLFQTVNFNEFGLLVTPAKGSEYVRFDMGQAISGVIRPGANIAFDFKGTVMRIEVVNGSPNYGIKFDSLESQEEAG